MKKITTVLLCAAITAAHACDTPNPFASISKVIIGGLTITTFEKKKNNQIKLKHRHHSLSCSLDKESAQAITEHNNPSPLLPIDKKPARHSANRSHSKQSLDDQFDTLDQPPSPFIQDSKAIFSKFGLSGKFDNYSRFMPMYPRSNSARLSADSAIHSSRTSSDEPAPTPSQENTDK